MVSPFARVALLIVLLVALQSLVVHIQRWVYGSHPLSPARHTLLDGYFSLSCKLSHSNSTHNSPLSPSIRPETPLANPINPHSMHITLRINRLIQVRTQRLVKNGTKPPNRRIARIGRIRLSHIHTEAQAGQLARRITRIGNARIEAE